MSKSPLLLSVLLTFGFLSEDSSSQSEHHIVNFPKFCNPYKRRVVMKFKGSDKLTLRVVRNLKIKAV